MRTIGMRRKRFVFCSAVLTAALALQVSAGGQTRAPVAVRAPSQIGRPIVVQAGTVRRTLALRTDSPYFASQLAGGTSVVTFTVLEIDANNNAFSYFHNHENKGLAPVGTDARLFVIDRKAAMYSVNFRYATAERQVTKVIWQASALPFPAGPTHWRPQEVAGLLAWGQVKDESVDVDGLRYFRLNFARVANHAVGAPPLFEGTASVAPGGIASPSQPVGARLPRAMAGPRPQTGTVAPPQGQAPQRMRLGTIAPARTPGARFVRGGLPDTDRVIYVRVIPMHSETEAGLAAIPVEVTVRRPHPCPTAASDIVVRPPSARIVWYMRPNFFDSTDANGRWYVVAGSTFEPQWAHIKDQPPKPQETAWYEKVISVYKSIIGYFSDVMTGWAQAFNALEDVWVDIIAKTLSYTITGGLFRCDQEPACSGLLKAGLQATMAAYGIPPTLPTGPELMNLSTDYLVKLGAEQLGAGDLYDAYKALDEVKDEMQGDAEGVSAALVNAQNAAITEQMQKSLCVETTLAVPLGGSKTVRQCTTRVPDPIFNSVHPATAMLWVENTNAGMTDPVVVRVTDSFGLYLPGTAVVPRLRPGEGLSIPVMLRENLGQFLDVNGGKCPSNNVVTVSGELPCQVQTWRNKFFQAGEYSPVSGKTPPDTFRVTFSVGSGASMLTGLDAQSSGRPLKATLQFDADALGGACVVNGAVRYPTPWQISTPARTLAADSWDNLFGGPPGQEGNPNGGALRTK
jgi:hypothetical protein